MKIAGLATSTDISIMADGKKVAVVQSYRARSIRESKAIEEFGSEVAVATVPGGRNHVIELTRLCATEEGTKMLDFFGMKDFTISIVKPTGTIAYSHCEWSEIDENCNVGGLLAEKMTVVASKRTVDPSVQEDKKKDKPQ